MNIHDKYKLNDDEFWDFEDDFDENDVDYLLDRYFANELTESQATKLTTFLKEDKEAGSRLISYMMDCIAFEVVAREMAFSYQTKSN